MPEENVHQQSQNYLLALAVCNLETKLKALTQFMADKYDNIDLVELETFTNNYVQKENDAIVEKAMKLSGVWK
jgi:hypothetical protein